MDHSGDGTAGGKALELDLAFAAKVLAAQPFSNLVGARVTAFGDGAATLELDVREDLRQQHGYVHGGVLAYLADNTVTFAAGSVLGPKVLTSGVTIDYLTPAEGPLLRAKAAVLHAGARRVTCRCEIFSVGEDGMESLCAAAQGTVVAVNSIA